MTENYKKIQESLSKKIQEDLYQISKNLKFEKLEVALGKICEQASKDRERKLNYTENVLRCLWVRNLIKKGKTLTFEIDLFYKFWFAAFDKVSEVEEIILRYCTMDMLEPMCIYISKKEKTDVSIFIGEEGTFLSIRDKDGKAYTVELADLCVIVVARDILIDETYGAVIEYTKFEEEHYIEFREKYSMDSVKTLLWEKYYGGRIKYMKGFTVEDKDVALFSY